MTGVTTEHTTNNSLYDEFQTKDSILLRDCREMLKIVFDFPKELIDKVIEIS